MSNAHTFSILFWVYSSRTSGDKKPIYARVTVNGRRANFSLKLKVDPLQWDSNRHRAKGNSQSARILNGYLDQAYAKLVHCYQMLRLKVTSSPFMYLSKVEDSGYFHVIL